MSGFSMTAVEMDNISATLHNVCQRVMDLGADSIQIVVTAPGASPDETAILKVGRGNMYARMGSVQEWLDDSRGIDVIPLDGDDGDGAWKGDE